MKWFSALGLFQFRNENPNKITRYEERVVVVQAESRSKAEEVILADFERYGSDDVGIEYLDEYWIEELEDPLGTDVVEVASTMRVIPQEPAEFIEAFWSELRPDSCDAVGWKHVWFNKGDGKSGCYNCCEVRPGQLWTSTETPEET
ncbi:MAG: hypothetical protein DRJ61_01745 [Acidobacteria bacterium]|nr:MAG: hypothetical protein DRJ61_01745 [Acidobacteriota bacterium]